MARNKASLPFMSDSPPGGGGPQVCPLPVCCLLSAACLLSADYAPSDSPPSGGGRQCCLCGHISHVCSSTGRSERVNNMLHFDLLSATSAHFYPFVDMLSCSIYSNSLLNRSLIHIPTPTLSPFLPPLFPSSHPHTYITLPAASFHSTHRSQVQVS